MSEFLAEAQVLIVPNTAAFAASLKVQLAKAVAEAGPVVIPVTAAPVGASVAKQVAAQTAVSTAAIAENTVALDAQGAAAQKAVVSQTALVKAERLQAEAEVLLSGAVEVASLKTTALARARSILATTSHAAAISEKAAAAAITSGNVAIQESTAALLANARAEEANATASVKNAIAHQREAVATAESAAAHAQATRGIAAETLALGGLRGATLAASAPFLVGATGAIILAKSIKEASDATEEFNKTAVVFGSSAEQIQHFSETTATSLGISSVEALRAAGVFGNLFRTIQISQPIAADMSEALVRLASDLASFNNADPTRTLEALRSGLVGQARPLRVFGIFLSAARVQQQALIDTQKKSVQELTQAELVQARFNVIFRDSTLAQGDFARTSGRAANQTRILKAQLADMEGEIGAAVLPALTGLIGLANEYVGVMRRAVKAGKDFQASLAGLPGPAGQAGGQIEGLEKKVAKLYFRFAILGPVMGAATLAEKVFASGAEDAAKKVSVFAGAIGAVADLIAALGVKGAKPLKDITQQLNALEVQRLKIQTGLAPGGRAAEEANLAQQIALDKKAVATAQSGTDARRQAIEELKSDQDDLARLQEEAAKGIKSATDSQKKSAADIARDQADATQAFIDAFSGKQGRLGNKITSAQLASNTTREIALNKALIQADKNEITAIQARIRHLKLHGDALKIAKATISALNQEIFNTRNAIQSLQSERKQALTDARQSHLEAILSIAETTASTKDDSAAEKALIKFDQVQIRRILAIKRRRRLTLDEAAQLDAYRVDLAQRNAALKETTDEEKKGRNQFAELSFQFLQMQQGFTSKLLSNLIPGSATAGLVGGGSAAAAQAAIRPPGLGVTQESHIAQGKDVGFSAGQGNTTNSILRKILHNLEILNGHSSHPEARNQRVMQSGSAHYAGV